MFLERPGSSPLCTLCTGHSAYLEYSFPPSPALSLPSFRDSMTTQSEVDSPLTHSAFTQSCFICFSAKWEVTWSLVHMLFICLFPLEHHLHGSDLLSALFDSISWHWQQYWAHSRCSIKICWLDTDQSAMKIEHVWMKMEGNGEKMTQAIMLRAMTYFKSTHS